MVFSVTLKLDILYPIIPAVLFSFFFNFIFVRKLLLFANIYVSGRGFPGGSVVKNPPPNAGDTGSIPGSKRSSGEENGNPPSILAWEAHGQRSLRVAGC